MTLYHLAQLLDVEHNFAFIPRGTETFCNDYASVFCAALGVRLPPIPASQQHSFLLGSTDWVTIGRAEAVTRANAGQLVLASVAMDPHGHIAPCVESPDSDPTGLYVSAAGARNAIRCKLEQSFGFLKPDFFTTTKE